MKRNKIRIDARIKPFLRKRMETVANKLEASYTELIENCLEKGLSWYINKIRRELDTHFLEQELPPKVQKNNKSKPKIEQSKAKTQPEIEEEEEPPVSDEEIKKMLDEYYKPKPKKKPKPKPEPKKLTPEEEKELF